MNKTPPAAMESTVVSRHAMRAEMLALAYARVKLSLLMTFGVIVLFATLMWLYCRQRGQEPVPSHDES